MSQQSRLPLYALIAIAAALTGLVIAYLPTMQTIPNGAEHYYMIDAGETQIVLNVWGTLHATGYPLYVMMSSAGVMLLRAFGIGPAAAPGAMSMAWGLGALLLMGVLAYTIQRRPLLIAMLIGVYGLTRSVWIHQVIAEIYTFGLLLLAALLLLALWRARVPGRVYWLALLGGIALGHHRAFIVIIPALLYAVWPEVIALIRRRPAHLVFLLALGLIGLLPYAYLYARAQSGVAWVYGEPGTLPGLWDQFIGTEAARFIGMPSDLGANIRLVSETLLIDVGPLGLLFGVIGLIVGAVNPATRRASVTLLLSGVCAYGFHCIFYSDILSALILIVTFSLAVGWFLLADALIPAAAPFAPPLTRVIPPMAVGLAVTVIAAAGAADLLARNRPFILDLTTDRTGVETIALAQHTPPGSTLMLAWGSRHFAVGFARSVLGILPGVALVDHKADMRPAAAAGTLITPDYTFYRQPITWWEEVLESPVYLHAVAPHLIAVTTRAQRAAINIDATTPPDGISVRDQRIACTPFDLLLAVSWQAHKTPPRDLSVFVHLLDAAGVVIAQDDQIAPVYGLRPTSRWLPGEIVRDVYALPRLPDGATVRYGLYTQRPDGVFENALITDVAIICPS